eukprot:4708585-Pyramimonas_sp.AAC.1
MTIDSHKANVRLAQFLFSTLPPSALGIVLRCMRHQTNLICKPLSIHMDVVNPMFCFVKQLHKGERGCQTKWHE